MSAKWYVRISHDKIAGPYTARQLKQAADSGRIHPRTVVRKGEAGDWVTADRIKGLLSLDAGNPVLAGNERQDTEIAA